MLQEGAAQRWGGRREGVGKVCESTHTVRAEECPLSAKKGHRNISIAFSCAFSRLARRATHSRW